MEDDFIVELLNKNIMDIEKNYPNSTYIKQFKQLKNEIRFKKEIEIERLKNKHKQELLNNYSQEKKYVESFRPISINQYGFFIDDNMVDFRVNVRYFSNDFEEVLQKYRKNREQNKLSSDEIRSIFNKEKDNLKHLSWKVDGFY